MSTAPATPQSLPQVVLTDKQIPLSVLQYIPLETAEKFQVAAFEADTTHLRLAIAHPEQLKQGFYVAIEEMGRKIHKEVTLYRTDSAGLQKVLKYYRETAGKGKKNIVPKPPLFELGKTVAYNYLRRIPLDFAHKHRVASVDFQKPNIYWFVTDGTRGAAINSVIRFIEEKNAIKAHLLTIRPNELDALLGYYETLERKATSVPKPSPVTPVTPPQPSKPKVFDTEPAKGSVIEKMVPRPVEKVEKKVEHSEPTVVVQADEGVKATASVTNTGGSQAPTVVVHVQTAPQAPVVVAAPVAAPVVPLVTKTKAEKEAEAKGIVTPDVQAKIISSEEERGGIAGLFQKVAQSFTAASEKKDEEEQLRAEAASEAAAAAPVPEKVSSGPVINASPSDAPMIEVVRDEDEETPAPSQRPAVMDEDGDIGKLLDKGVDSLEELKEHVQKGFIPRIVAAVVNFAIHEKASDIHIETFDDEVRIRYRIDGQLLDIIKLPPDLQAAVVSRIKILSRLRLDETRIPQDGRFDVNFNNAQVDLRVSVMPTVHGEKVVMRILDKSRGITSLEKLGVEGLAYSNLTKAIQKPFGICLATGPTGSGKSTSLYAILNRIATPNVNVVTLEDPVEYEMKGVNQSQIRPKIGYTFAEGLRSILRQDPNIIMVGEIRDGETANMSTQAALTGHLVLSTLHTNDASGAIPRLTNMGIEPFLITSSLNVAMGQRLVRKICQYCKQEVTLPQGLQDKFKRELELIAQASPEDATRASVPVKFHQGVGCAHCGGKGYQGRLGIYEVLVMSEAIEELTMKRASNLEIQSQAQKEGMLTMYQDGLLKVVNGITTLDEVLRETSTK